MARFERDKTPMLSETDSQVDVDDDSQFRRLGASMSAPINPVESYENQNTFVGHSDLLRNERRTPFVQMSGPLFIRPKNENAFQSTQGALGHKTSEPAVERYPSSNVMDQNDWLVNSYAGKNEVERYPSSNVMDQNDWLVNSNAGKNEHLLKSGQLGMCNDPYCTTCPTYYEPYEQKKKSKSCDFLDQKFHNMIYGDAEGWAKRTASFFLPYIPPVMNPHAKVVQRWNKFLVISFLFAIFLDPMFFFLLYVQQENNCIVLNWHMTTTVVVLRSLTDFIYLMHILLQFRLAYVAPESRVVGAGDLVDHPKKIALHYLSGYFLIDFFIVLPLPQIIVLLILPDSMGASEANYAKNLLRAAFLVQYIPRLCRFLPLLADQSPSGLVQSAGAYFAMNYLTYLLSSHVVGSLWYLFGLQRVTQCLWDACQSSGIDNCMKFIDCGHGNDPTRFASYPTWDQWQNNDEASACFGSGNFSFGIYVQAVSLTTQQSIVTKYVYSLYWGLQQLSTLAGNQVPSYFVPEIAFLVAITALALLLFVFLLGNMQNFLQSVKRRKFEKTLRQRDVEQWMSHRRLPEELRRKVRDAERYSWAATRGVNEELLMENLPEDLQREIRRHLFKFVKKVRIFTLLDEHILDAICERLRPKTYIKGSKILYRGALIDKMVFIVRGKMDSIGEDGIMVPLCEGDVCGEELLTWCLEHSSVNKDVRKIRIPGHRLLSNRQVRCLTNVEVFVLRPADLEEVTSLFARFLRNPRVQGAIRYESPYWRGLAARRIQVAWRYIKKRQGCVDSSSPPFNVLHETEH